MIGAMLVVSVIYIAVSITAVSVVPWQDLAAAPGPLRAVIERAAPWFPAIGFTFITIAAVANTALVNYVMGSRLLYGMAQQKLLPAALGRIHQTRRTPHIAVGVLFVVVAGLQLAGNITQLASATVLLLLIVFATVNGALIILKRREGNLAGRFNAPVIVPVLGSMICLAMIFGQLFQGDMRAPLIAGGLVALILTAYVLTRGRGAPTGLASE
jgi:amino acid transporter